MQGLEVSLHVCGSHSGWLASWAEGVYLADVYTQGRTANMSAMTASIAEGTTGCIPREERMSMLVCSKKALPPS
jgi:hypothetical protein